MYKAVSKMTNTELAKELEHIAGFLNDGQPTGTTIYSRAAIQAVLRGAAKRIKKPKT